MYAGETQVNKVIEFGAGGMAACAFLPTAL